MDVPNEKSDYMISAVGEEDRKLSGIRETRVRHSRVPPPDLIIIEIERHRAWIVPIHIHVLRLEVPNNRLVSFATFFD